jgi:hypothetical protein
MMALAGFGHSLGLFILDIFFQEYNPIFQSHPFFFRKELLMAREEIYQATRKVFALYGAFYNLVVEQIGKEKALYLHAKAHEQLGITAGKILRDKAGKETAGLQSLGNILREGNLSIGIESEVAERNATSIIFHNLQCSVYDGYRLGGLDDKTAEALCRWGAPAKLGSTLAYLNPDTKYTLQYYRRKPNEPCEEVIQLKG